MGKEGVGQEEGREAEGGAECRYGLFELRLFGWIVDGGWGEETGEEVRCLHLVVIVLVVGFGG